MAPRKGSHIKQPPRRGKLAAKVAKGANDVVAKVLTSPEVTAKLGLEDVDVERLKELSRKYIRGGAVQLGALKLRMERAYGLSPVRVTINRGAEDEELDLSKLSDEQLEELEGKIKEFLEAQRR